MTTDQETARAVRAWLREGVTQLPDRALDTVLDEVPATRQRRGPWWAVRRMLGVNSAMSLGMATAIVVTIGILIGIQSLGGVSTVGGPGPDSGPAQETSTAEPTGSPEPSRRPEGDLPTGAFLLSDGRFDDGLRNVPVTVTIPSAGWYGEPRSGIVGNIPVDQDFGPGDAWMIGPFVGDIYVPADPCEWATTMPPTPATTVDEVVAALRGQASRAAQEPEDITVDGRAGTSLTLRVPEDAELARCDRNPLSDEPEYCTLAQDNPGTCHRYHQFPGQIDELWVLDVNGEVVVINATWDDTTPPEALAELRTILESVDFH